MHQGDRLRVAQRPQGILGKASGARAGMSSKERYNLGQKPFTDDIRTAVRRGILENTHTGLRLLCRTIGDYGPDFLVEQLLAGMGSTWWERDELIDGTARWLGFRHTGKNIRKALRTAIATAVSRRLLDRDGPDGVRRTR
jgi:hypothetical protein